MFFSLGRPNIKSCAYARADTSMALFVYFYLGVFILHVELGRRTNDLNSLLSAAKCTTLGISIAPPSQWCYPATVVFARLAVVFQTLVHLLLGVVLVLSVLCHGVSVCVAVVKVPLNGRCSPGDECLSRSALCVRGLCRCNDDFYDRQGVCGELPAHTFTRQVLFTCITCTHDFHWYIARVVKPWLHVQFIAYNYCYCMQ